MPIAACAYPISMGEHMIAVIRDSVVSEDHLLRWPMQMSTPTSPEAQTYNLYCNWQGRAVEIDDHQLVFIENAVGWVDWDGNEATQHLDVRVAFGRPHFVDGIASMVVDFDVSERATDGTLARNIRRPFRIYANGQHEPAF